MPEVEAEFLMPPQMSEFVRFAIFLLNHRGVVVWPEENSL